jgi:type IV pilus modification protein PilV
MSHTIQRAAPRGLTLLEVLVSAVVLAIGIQGALAAWGQARRAEQGAQWSHVALALAQSMVHQLHSNPQAQWPSADTPSAPSGPVPCFRGPCTPDQQAQSDWQGWQQRLRNELPEGLGRLSALPGQAGWQVLVRWHEPGLEPSIQCSAAPSPATRCLTLRWVR